MLMGHISELGIEPQKIAYGFFKNILSFEKHSSFIKWKMGKMI
jgi:hypothetical protein